MIVIRYIHTKDLKPNERDVLKTIVETELLKIERMIPDALELIVDIKVLKPEDKITRRHILNVKLTTKKNGIFRTKVGESDLKRSGSYDLTMGTRIVMDKLQSEIKHKLKRDSSVWKRISEKFKFSKKGEKE